MIIQVFGKMPRIFIDISVKRHLISQVPLVIIYLESESDVSPICPQLNYDYLKEINILNFGRWGCLFLFVKMIIYVRQSRKNY